MLVGKLTTTRGHHHPTVHNDKTTLPEWKFVFAWTVREVGSTRVDRVMLPFGLRSPIPEIVTNISVDVRESALAKCKIVRWCFFPLLDRPPKQDTIARAWEP